MIVLYVLAGLVLVLIVLMLVAPKGAKLERAIVANVSPEQAFQSLRSLKNFDEWSPWNNRDPNQIRGYKGKEGELGSIAWWKGNKEVGEGEQEVKLLDPNSYIETELRFQKPFKAVNRSYWRITQEGNGTKVTWGFEAKFKMPMNIMFLFISMEGAIGKDYEVGLERWKSYVEKPVTL
ncbi:MAG: SRPBCC family protein [Bacteroidia bacterium]|nr:SRPBCC family protein [Bacteroidota bacterium]MBP8074186.1 SRPBCC family protein [Bacteroidia bacterium]